MKKKTVIILVVLLAALTVGTAVTLASCQNPQQSEKVQSSSVSDSSTESGTEESPEASEESVVSEETSAESKTESSAETSEDSKTESSKESKTESSEDSKAESSKESKSEGSKESKAESSKTETKPTTKTESKPATKPTTTKTETKQAPKITATSVTLDINNLNLTAGGSRELNAYVHYSDGSSNYSGITWSSSNTGVATVDGYGNVYAHSAGTAQITASYGSFKASCSVTVKAAQQSKPQTQTPTTSNNNNSGGNSGGSSSNSSNNNGGSGNNRGSTTKKQTNTNNNSGGSTTTKKQTNTNNSGGNGGGSTKTKKETKSKKSNDNSPVITEAWLKANCTAVKTKFGITVYEIPQLINYVNEERVKNGVQSVSWRPDVTRNYNDFINSLKQEKAEAGDPAFYPYLQQNYPGAFDDNGNIILTEETFNKQYKRTTNELANETAYIATHGIGHEYGVATVNASYNEETTVRELVTILKESEAHYWCLCESTSIDQLYACIVDYGGTLFLSVA